MAEYWKSTPKYWCKFCSIYVRDTKFDRNQHDATGRHQGNIQRSLRGLHRDQEAEKRKQQRAKDEVARLNGIVAGGGSGGASSSKEGAASSSASASAPGNDTRVGAKPTFSRDAKQATMEDRKKQISQLAAMGVAVPESMRGELALAGEWQVVSEKVIGEEEKPLNKGVHKRKLDEAELEAQAAGELITKQKGWGKTFKSFPGKHGSADDDIDALFGKGKKPAVKEDPDVKSEQDVSGAPAIDSESGVKQEDGEAGDLKQEGGEGSSLANIPTQEEAEASAAAVKKEEDAPAPAVFFKKRKKIAR
ncbi:hypothetical protein BU24DRAFT_418627 [Aaosphaeria arxii CBS 175.79]|uniref:U1-C C2H2-type zinc finger domain-containing protein n=1 Tax=Aaosphaeria arxii CBS 175.79 TaxID=1450172 RepID=A0A6A5Y1B3_9PLEO|nr:uncharacterized protein BU24DRAFT_418627 [Aaosphaeria arxii CBS 175.79]KAF2019036.1 hypothetical protein BU24DRAFT_418627 [Aaosphaeria arxii CBS 175.79]